jgi:hypothetical protein
MSGRPLGARRRRRLWPVAPLFVLFAGLQPPHTGQHAGVEISVTRIERLSRDEAHFQVKVRNGSGTSVFLTAIDYARLGVKDGSGPQAYPVYIEQWRGTEGWKIVAPCMDSPPPHVMRLSPAASLIEDRALKVPLGGPCKERNVQLEGKFRFRLDYFQSEAQARHYIETLFSPQWKQARAAAALSQEFEMPPFRTSAER